MSQEEEPKSLAAYARRIGAERKSFRRYVIREEAGRGYSRDKFLIAVAADGEIKVRSNLGKQPDKSEPIWPTEAEQSTIKAEVALAIAAEKWPQSINASLGQAQDECAKLRKESGSETEFYIFRAPKGDEVLFVQQRVHTEKGKADIPWSFWSDCKWRPMEPDRLEDGLPLFGLEQLKDARRLFIHEGAKGALHVQYMVGARGDVETEGFMKKHPHLADCPWKGELSAPGAVHVGWPGGGPNSWRVDWSPIAALPPDIEVIVVCDHDAIGEEAVSAISRRLRRSMSALRFDDRFPEGFDLADAWPKHEEWWHGGSYVGPSLGQMLEPATWATDIKPNPDGKGRPALELRKEFAREWFYSLEPAAFIHRDYCDRLYKAEAFNALVRPFSDAEDTARLFTRSFQAQVAGIEYRPTTKRALRRAEVRNVDGDRLVNTFRPASIVPTKGDAGPWLRYMEHLIPDKSDRHETLRWCATLIDRPEVKMFYNLLLLSEAQGIGKTTLGEGILAPLVGHWNASFPNEKELVNSNFNSWAAHKRLAVCNEIYTGSSRKAYDSLKSITTDKKIDVQRKYMESYTIENYLHILACSNSMQALYLDAEDRRWFVPRVTEQKRPKEYWREFYAWLNGGGHAIISGWASDFLKKKGNAPVAQGEPAPLSSRKAEVISESRSDGSRMAYDLAKLAMGRAEKIVLSVEDVRAFVAGKRKLELHSREMEKLATLRKMMRQAGMVEPERKDDADEIRRFQIRTGENKEYVIANFKITPDMEWADLKKYQKSPNDLLKL